MTEYERPTFSERLAARVLILLGSVFLGALVSAAPKDNR